MRPTRLVRRSAVTEEKWQGGEKQLLHSTLVFSTRVPSVLPAFRGSQRFARALDQNLIAHYGSRWTNHSASVLLVDFTLCPLPSGPPAELDDPFRLIPSPPSLRTELKVVRQNLRRVGSDVVNDDPERAKG